MDICRITADKAEKYIKLLLQLDTEAQYMMFEKGERKINVKSVKADLSQNIDSKVLLLGVEYNSELIGFVSANRGSLNKIKHSANIVIGILEAYTSQGLGKRLLNEVSNWALDNSINRLELTVMALNERAICLYKKMGFIIEGIKERAYFVEGEYINGICMAKLI